MISILYNNISSQLLKSETILDKEQFFKKCTISSNTSKNNQVDIIISNCLNNLSYIVERDLINDKTVNTLMKNLSSYLMCS